MKIDIITGFLGAGKTTFIAKYAKYLQDKNEKILIIENELGVAGVDGFALKEEELDIAEISGGCACCTQIPRLVACINEAKEDGYDRIIFEPTGIYNLDSFFNMLEHPSMTVNPEISAIITIVKPDFLKHQDTAKNIILSQFLSTGAVVFSNTQSYENEQINQTILDLNNFVKENNSDFNLSNLAIYTKDWKDFEDEDFKNLSSIGRTFCEHKQVYENHAAMLQSMFFLGRFKEKEDAENLIKELFSKKDLGIIRVKGFFSDSTKKIYFVNCTETCTFISESSNKHTLITVIGTKIDDAKIREIVDKYN
ncbi:MAG: GTP-binding protein [Clostridia bacterium]